MTTTTTPPAWAAQSLKILRDYTTELEAALAAGDTDRAACAAATIVTETDMIAAVLGGYGLARITGINGVYTEALRPAAARTVEGDQA